MIKLNKDFSPVCLAPSNAATLTRQFQLTGEPVWNFDELKKLLLQTSSGKCAYCECRLSVESKYMEVEHFLDKRRRPDLVVSLNNFLPACKRCNASKGGQDVETDPIINPYSDDPVSHLSFKLYRLKAKSAVGQTTIDVLHLNDPERVVRVRFEVGEKVLETLANAVATCRIYVDGNAVRARNRLLTQTRGILMECQPSSEYAATCATILHSSTEYRGIREVLTGAGLWTDEFEEMHRASLRLVLD